MPSAKQRVFVAVALGIASGLVTYLWSQSYGRAGGDFGIAIAQARELLAGRTPYPAMKLILYPLPAVMFAVPFTIFSSSVAAGIFFGGSTALLAFFLSRSGWWRLLVFTGAPYLWSLFMVQWIPLLMVSVFVPWIGGMALKPQIGIPCAVASRKWSSFWSHVLWGLASLVIRPTWPMEFLRQARGYPHLYPILYFIGPVMLIALFWWRDKVVRFFLVMASVPQRFLYDSFPLWLIPENPREMLFLSAFSWLGVIYWYPTLPSIWYDMVWKWSLISSYLPAFLILGVRRLPDAWARRVVIATSVFVVMFFVARSFIGFAGFRVIR